MPSDPKRLQSIFLAAVEADDRAAVLDRECGGDADLRRHVEKLLAAHDDSAELPAANGATGDYASAAIEKLALGSVFARRYKLREQLGEGGMGVVYVADQLEPVQRRVALKIIRANLPTETLLARFEQERQALALMDHPNIAKVYDAGIEEPRTSVSGASEPLTDVRGSPYFVMELIKGLPITKYCDDAKLTPKQRLELFIPVCQAVQHAHQKGIIHRDLKPANIIVGLYDGRPVPKVIDFGVAKMTGPRLTEHSVYTEVGSIIGTLEYMSPEQAELNNLDIDTRTDIYALGVILYELLTGTVPFSRKEMQSAGFAEMLRIIKEQEPSKPSTKLSGSGSLPSVAACRHTEPAKLTRLVRGELDWITMKALEKDRSRRYETADGLALDIQRYLDDEPVLASPPSAAYRVRKFVRRNKGKVATASGILMLLVLGVAGTTWGLIVAEGAYMRLSREEAIRRMETQRAVTAQKSEAAERAKAEAALTKAQEETVRADRELSSAIAVNAFLHDVLFAQGERTGDMANAAQMRPIVDRASARIDGAFVDQPLQKAAIRSTIGRCYQSLGDLDKAQNHLERAFETSSQHLGRDNPNYHGYAYDLALLYLKRELYSKADPLLLDIFEHAYGQRRGPMSLTFSAQYPKLELASLLGMSFEKQGKHEAAERLLRPVVKQQADSWLYWHVNSLLGASLSGQKKYSEAAPLLLAGYEGMKQREKSIPPQTKVRLTEAAERLVNLYTTWHAAEPARGYDVKAAEWKAELEAIKHAP